MGYTRFFFGSWNQLHEHAFLEIAIISFISFFSRSVERLLLCPCNLARDLHTWGVVLCSQSVEFLFALLASCIHLSGTWSI